MMGWDRSCDTVYIAYLFLFSLTFFAPSTSSICPNNLVDAKDTSTSKVQSSKNFSWGLLEVMKPLTTNGPGRCPKTKNMMDSRTCYHNYLFMFCIWSGRSLHRRRLVLRRVPHLWRVGDDRSSLCWWCQLLWHHGWEKDIRMDGKSQVTGLHKLWTVLLSWADRGSCAPKCVS